MLTAAAVLAASCGNWAGGILMLTRYKTPWPGGEVERLTGLVVGRMARQAT